jgi:hypothetical protein
MLWNDVAIPHNVPNNPMNGETLAVVDSNVMCFFTTSSLANGSSVRGGLCVHLPSASISDVRAADFSRDCDQMLSDVRVLQSTGCDPWPRTAIQ